MKSKKKLKQSVPKYTIINRDGKRYVKMGKKMIRIDDDISERQLIKFIINTLHKKRIRGAVKRREVDRSNIKDKSFSTSGDKGLANTYALTSALLKVDRDKALLALEDSKKPKIAPSFAITKPALPPPVNKFKDQVVLFDESGNVTATLPKNEFQQLQSSYLNKAKQSAEDKAKLEREQMKKDSEMKASLERQRLNEIGDAKLRIEQNKNALSKELDDARKRAEKKTEEYFKQNKLNKLFNEYVKEKKVERPKKAKRGFIATEIITQILEEKGLLKTGADFQKEEIDQNPKIKQLKDDIDRLELMIKETDDTPIDVNDSIETPLKQQLQKIPLTIPEEKTDDDDEGEEVLPKFKYEDVDEEVIGYDDEEESSGKGKRTSDYGLTNIQIDDMMSKYPEYLGTVAHNEIPTRILPKVKEQSRGCFIINTDNANQDGEHWQAVYFDGRPNGDKEINFYDSFGRYADKHILDGINQIAHKLNCKSYMRLKENRIQLQNDNTGNCGFFCVKFLIDRLNGRHFTNATGWDDAITNHSKQGEEAVNNFKKQIGYGPWKFLPSFGDIVRGVKEGARRVYTAITGRKSAPPVVQKLLDEHGDSAIVSIDVARSPVLPVIKSIMNIISSGQIEENKNKLGYDDIYHLYLIIKLKDGKAFKIERNEDVSVSDPNVSSDSQIMPVQLNGDITLNGFIDKGSKKSNFWNYDARTSNCQQFVYDLLNGSGLMTPSLKDFILQDAEGLLENSPITEALSKGLTNLKQALNILIGGRKNRKVY